MKHVTLDNYGLPVAFYDSQIHAAIPARAVEISDAQYRDLLDNPGFRRWNGTTVVPCDPPPPPPADPAVVRADRDHRLTACDWTLLPDAPLSASVREAWILYRQALRDVPAQPGFPDVVQWPVPPA